LSVAQNLATSFNGAARQLEETQSSVNRSIEDAVNKVNILAGNVATLNQEIIVAEGGGTEASGLRDQRQEYIKELSSLIDVHYYEAEDGAFYVSVAGGHSLVSGNTSQPLSAVPLGIQGHFEVRAGANNITNLISGGEVAGFIEIRDQKIPTYLGDLDTLANTIITQVNTQHALGTDLLGNAGGNFFNPTPAPPAPLVLPAGAARNFSVSAALVADARLVAAGQSGEAGDNANALALAGLAAVKTLNGGTETFAEGFASLQFRVGTDTQGAKRTLDAQSAVLTQLQNQRDSVSGVSLDEEALDLVRFQRAYQAATKFISTIDQLTGDIIAAFGG
jgi:flagellar hook-associated protein 1